MAWPPRTTTSTPAMATAATAMALDHDSEWMRLKNDSGRITTMAKVTMTAGRDDITPQWPAQAYAATCKFMQATHSATTEHMCIHPSCLQHVGVLSEVQRARTGSPRSAMM